MFSEMDTQIRKGKVINHEKDFSSALNRGYDSIGDMSDSGICGIQ